MRQLFSESAKLRWVLEVEAALARAHAAVGNVPKEAARRISSVAKGDAVRLERVKEIEAEVQHDLMAIVKALSEAAGDSGRWVHLGATSYDAIDTANALQFREALALVRGRLVALIAVLAKHAAAHRDTVMLGRTHGQMATPITFGLKMAVFAAEFLRHVERLDEAVPRVCVGKMSGPVGTGAGLGKHHLRIQALVMKDLGLGVEEASTQIVQRDRYVELVSLLAGIATGVERLATEVRNLQRSEIDEVREPFDEARQVGSSSMPHKQNPTLSENASGLARLVRANVVVAHENAVQWHERDLANSAPERFVIPHAFLLTDWILHQMVRALEGLRIYPEHMQGNLAASRGLVLAESFTVLLTQKGMARQDAHEVIRQAALAASRQGRHLGEALKADDRVTQLLAPRAIDEALDYANYTGSAGRIVDQVLRRVEAYLARNR